MPKTEIAPDRFRGVWSATPTPFTNSMKIDKVAVRRLVKHHLRLGIKGLFLGGTCGEGPWMADEQRRALISSVAECAQGRLVLAAQVTDNSAARILANMEMVKDAGADVAVIAPPYFLLNATPQNVTALYLEAIRNSPLPVGVYDRGRHGPVLVPDAALRKIYAEPNVVLVKDSSTDPGRMKIALAARKKRQQLRLLNGDEFACVRYLEAGYDGLLLGGGIFNGCLAGMMLDAVAAGDLELAERLQKRMNRLMWDVYGGRKISCWLAGLKELLVRMDIFRTNCGFLGFRLTDSCSRRIDAALEREADVLFP